MTAENAPLRPENAPLRPENGPQRGVVISY